MPLEIKDELIQELLKRQEMADRFAPESEPSAPEQSTLSPTQALLTGGLADALSTYTFLKQGNRTEDNALLGGLNNKPLPTAVAAGGTTLAMLLLQRLLAKKAPKLADTLAGGLGAYQTGLAAGNLDMDNRGSATSSEATNDMLADVVTGSRRRAPLTPRERQRGLLPLIVGKK